MFPNDSFYTFMLMIKKLLNVIGKIIYNYTEYVYFYTLPMTKEESEKGNKYRTEILSYITTNMKKQKPEFTDFMTTYSTGETFFIIATKENNPFFLPLFYEIYAYTKIKDMKKFTYNYETLIFKETTILKFKIKCYGKR